MTEPRTNAAPAPTEALTTGGLLAVPGALTQLGDPAGGMCVVGVCAVPETGPEPAQAQHRPAQD